MADTLSQLIVVQDGALYDQSSHAVRSESYSLIFTEWGKRKCRLQTQGEFLDIRIGRPEIGHIDTQA